MSFNCKVLIIVKENYRKAQSQSSEERILVRDCLHWTDLGACLWGIVLVKVIDMGRPHPLWVVQLPRKKDWNYESEEMELRTTSKQATSMYLCSLCS